MIIHPSISVGNLRCGMKILKSYLNERMQPNYLKLKTNRIILIKQFHKNGQIILHVFIKN